MQTKLEPTQKDRPSLLLQMELKRSDYVKARRPLLWYGSSVSIFLTIFILGIIVVSIFGNNTYLDGWVGSSIFICGIILLALFIIFFFGFRGLKRIKNLLSVKEEIEFVRLRLRLLDEFEAHRLSSHESYREELSRAVLQYKRQANRYRSIHYAFQFFIILLSLLVASLTSGLTNLINFAGKPCLTPVLSLFVSFLTAMVTLFRPHHRGFNLQQTADAIEYQIKMAKLRIFDYDGLSDEDALKRLAERGERLTDEQRKRQLQLEQASQTKHITE